MSVSRSGPGTTRRGAIVRLDTATYQRVLGDELRRLRKQRGWTRRDLNRRLQSDISLQTLA
ncbi:MAG: XRE family transcriptional regulator, partial [Actinophytocola sp.]